MQSVSDLERCSLNHDLLAVDDVQAADGLLYTLAGEVIDDGGLGGGLCCDAFYGNGSGLADVAKFEVVKCNPGGVGFLHEDADGEHAGAVALEVYAPVCGVVADNGHSPRLGTVGDTEVYANSGGRRLAVGLQTIEACGQCAAQGLADLAVGQIAARCPALDEVIQRDVAFSVSIGVRFETSNMPKSSLLVLTLSAQTGTFFNFIFIVTPYRVILGSLTFSHPPTEIAAALQPP